MVFSFGAFAAKQRRSRRGVRESLATAQAADLKLGRPETAKAFPFLRRKSPVSGAAEEHRAGGRSPGEEGPSGLRCRLRKGGPGKGPHEYMYSDRRLKARRDARMPLCTLAACPSRQLGKRAAARAWAADRSQECLNLVILGLTSHSISLLLGLQWLNATVSHRVNEARYFWSIYSIQAQGPARSAQDLT